MRLLTTVECTTDFPDDVVWDGDDLVTPAGRNIATALADLFASKGAEVTPVEPHKFYGWAFETSWDGARYWVMATWPETVFIHAQQLGWLSRLPSNRRKYRDFLLTLHAMLKEDGRFHHLKWLPPVLRDPNFEGRESPIAMEG